MDIVVKAENLRKKYGDNEVVKGLNFEVGAGECFGFLGPNGAGKTTTVRMIQCYSPPSGGSLKIFGMDAIDDAAKIKAMIGVVPQEDLLDIDLKVRENLTVFARYYGIPKAEAEKRADEALAFLELKEKEKEKVDKLSGGMKRRLVIARALINKPRLLMFDEPTTGLDPQARHLIWSRIRDLKSQGVTSILTTHYMDEASRLCDRIAIMDKGVFIAEGKPADLVRERVGEEVVEIRSDKAEVSEIEKMLGGRSCSVEKHGDTLFVFSDKSCSAGNILGKAGFEHYLQRPASLEDVFLKLTGRELRE